MYGMTSEGTTTDLYTEIFGSSPTAAGARNGRGLGPTRSARGDATRCTNRFHEPAAPGPTERRIDLSGPAGPDRDGRSRRRKPAAAQPAPVQVAQQPAPPAPPPEPDVPTAYGITANGPTTDLYTAIFGPGRATASIFSSLGGRDLTFPK